MTYTRKSGAYDGYRSHWLWLLGTNLVRNFDEVPGARVIAVSDLSGDRLKQAQTRYPAIKTTADYRELLTDSTIDAIVVATPVASHFDLAMQALHSGKHVLVEKPLAASAEQGERLIEEAARCKRLLMVDHTFVYTGAVRKIKQCVQEGRLGELYYYDSVRVNLGLFQHDVNVLWDLAVHDLSIMDYVLAARLRAVAAIGVAHVPGQPKDVAYLTCFFENQPHRPFSCQLACACEDSSDADRRAATNDCL